MDNIHDEIEATRKAFRQGQKNRDSIDRLVSVFQDEKDTFLGGGTEILDDERWGGGSGIDSTLQAVGNGNTASRGSSVLSVVDEGVADGGFKVAELGRGNDVTLKVDGLETAFVVIGVSAVVADNVVSLKTALIVIGVAAVVADNAGDTLGRVVHHASELAVSSAEGTSGGGTHDESLERVTFQAHVVSIHIGGGLDLVVGDPDHVVGRDLGEIL